MESFFNKQQQYAVVGVSADANKYGYKVWHFLKNSGYQLWPVNPKYANYDGQKCWAVLADLPAVPAGVVAITPPAVSLSIARQCVALGIKKLWLQPGAESAEIVDFAQESGLELVSGQCLMLGPA